MKTLYALRVRDDDSTRPAATNGLQLATNSALNSDVPDVSTLSADAGSRPLRGILAGEYAELAAREFEELFSATGIEVVPWFDPEDDSHRDRYVSLQNVDVTRAAPSEARLQRYSGELTDTGTPASFYRALDCNPQDVDNPFASTSTAEVALSVRATGAEWYNSTDGSRESATVQRTVQGEHDAINIYDATEPSFGSPTLIHQIPFESEWPTDVRVWDDYDRPKVAREGYDGPTVGSATVGEDSVGNEKVIPSTWQRCFVTGHRFVGRPVLETDRLRLRADLDRQRLVASRWSPSDGQYTLVQLGQSGWRLRDLDISRIGIERIEAQTTWVNVSNSNSHRLDLSLERGWDDALWTAPDNGSSPPQTLIDRLDPIAKPTDQDAAAVLGLVERKEVRE